MYGKMINGLFTIAPLKITEEEVTKHGFKPVVLTPPPETDENHYPVETDIEETATEFIRHWRVEEFRDDPDLSSDEALEILLGGTEL